MRSTECGVSECVHGFTETIPICLLAYRKHETDGTEPKREEDETELPKASSAPSQHKRELQANGETGGTKREKNKSGDISFEAYFCQIFNDAYDLNFKNSVEAMGSRLHVKRCLSQDWHNEVSHGCSIGSAMDDASK